MSPPAATLHTQQNSNKLPPPPPRRRVTYSNSYTAPTTTTTTTTTTTGADRRSPQGVQLITRKVIRKLEELGGHSDSEDMETESDRSEDDVAVSNSTKVNGNGNGVSRSNKVEGIVIRKGTVNGAVDKAVVEVQKIDWEIPRKVLHSSIGFFTIYLYTSNGSPKTVIYVLWSALCIIAPADFIRLRWTGFERFYERVLGFLMRESEKHTTNGVIWYIIGVNFALMFYPLDVATVAILILSWADTAASTIGRLWGRYTPKLPSHLPIVGLPLAPRKSVAGFVAAFVTGAAIAIGFWGWMAGLRQDVTWSFDGPTGGWVGLSAIGLVAGVVSAVAEALDLGSLDDNLTLPIISGGCLFGFFKFLGWVGERWLSR